MKPEDKELLMKDLCGRLPYGVKAQVLGWDEEKGEVEVPLKVYSINTDEYVYFENNDYYVDYLPLEDLLLFLKPMSSMTKEEIQSFRKWQLNYENITHDWLNAHHFDYRGLIEKGLALEAPKDMYK